MANTATLNVTVSAPSFAGAAYKGGLAKLFAAVPLPTITADALTGNGAGLSQVLAFSAVVLRVNNRRAQALNSNFPTFNAPFVDPKTGLINPAWHRLLLALWNRTGGSQGVQSPST